MKTATWQTFSSESVLRRPFRVLAEMIGDAFGWRETSWMLAVRDIKAEYRQSLLGLFWAIVPPLVMAIGVSYAQRANVLNAEATNLPLPAYVIFGVALWQTFTSAVLGPTRGLRSAKGMLTRVAFPRETVLTAEFLRCGFGVLCKSILFVGVFIYYRIPLAWPMLLGPFAIVLLILFGFAVGMLLAPLGLLYEDVGNAVAAAFNVGVFLVPVFYPVPKGDGIVEQFIRFNPVSLLLDSTRALLTGNPVFYPTAFLATSAVSIVLLLIAGLFFRASMPIIVERWSS